MTTNRCPSQGGLRPAGTATATGDGAAAAAVPFGRIGPAGAPLRRQPAQRRSRARVQRMLDACAELLDESGYHELSTTRIAERAGVAIGSIYQFFPDKYAITQALCLRFLEMFTLRVAAVPGAGWAATVDTVIDTYIDMHRTVPGFRTLRFGDFLPPAENGDGAPDTCPAPSTTNNQVLIARLHELLAPTVELRDGADLELALTVAVEAVDAALRLAFQHDPDGDAATIAEGKRLVHAYLGQHFRT